MQRTRRSLIETALELFHHSGFDGVTLDELCERVEVSKRTFFRYFRSKEDVAMAPMQDLWSAYLEDLRTIEPDGRPLLDVTAEALDRALRRVATEYWVRQALRSCQLAEQTPSMNAHGLEFCERTARRASDIIYQRFDVDADGIWHLRVIEDMLLAAFRRALAQWAEQASAANSSGTPRTGSADLAALFRSAVSALPDSLALTAGRRVIPMPAELAPGAYSPASGGAGPASVDISRAPLPAP